MLHASAFEKRAFFAWLAQRRSASYNVGIRVQPIPSLVSMPSSDKRSIGLLLSGGLDSATLLSHLLDDGRRVHPIYIRTNSAWQAEELTAIHRRARL